MDLRHYSRLRRRKIRQIVFDVSLLPFPKSFRMITSVAVVGLVRVAKLRAVTGIGSAG
jgi:hypothetical protein